MGKYVLRRLLVAIPVLLLVTFLDFVFINAAPGDVIIAMLDPSLGSVSLEDLEPLREKLGLDKPMPVRYLIWLGQIVRGNLGISYSTPVPVMDRIAQRLPNTLLLTSAALLIAVVFGTTVGILSALRQYSIMDYFSTVFAFIGVSIPNFFFGLLAIYVFAVRLDWLPAFGTHTIGADPSLGDKLVHVIMPASVLGLSLTATFMRYGRSALLEVLRQDYVTTARAKGLRERSVLFRHALRNSLLPLITVLGLRVPALFGGSVIVESIFTWPGIGQLTLDATLQRDYPQLMGILLIVAVIVVVANLLADVAYGFADPRIRYD